MCACPHVVSFEGVSGLKNASGWCRNGGQLIWIAPSGGRDRPDPVTQEWVPVCVLSISSYA